MKEINGELHSDKTFSVIGEIEDVPEMENYSDVISFQNDELDELRHDTKKSEDFACSTLDCR